jgi:dipeptidyl aminopeptidase/acylaminoacyl peptidase
MGGKEFIFVVIDGRGTPGRGRKFQNYQFGQVQAADQVAGLRALAATRPYMDLGRVGVMGGSWGGYFGLRTMLEAPDLYRAGVFYAGAFEMPRMRVSAEPFMGCSKEDCPQAYAKASNLAMIERLRAPLLVLHGTADNDVPIGESLNLVAALKRHRKPHEFVAINGWNHFVSNWPEFGPRAMAFFRTHLGQPENTAHSRRD